MLIEVAVVLAVGALTFALRVLPRLRCPDFGVDTWYYLAWARCHRRERRWPVTMPCYLLDDPEQVYPPGLPWLLSWCPTRWLERWHWTLSAAVDAAHGGVLCAVAWGMGASPLAVALAGLLFATSPVLVTQATELNARPVGNLLFTMFMLSLWGFERTPGWGTVALVVLAGILVLWTHKMTSQQMMAALGVWTLVQQDLRYLGLGLAMLALSLLVSGGWYLKVLAGHREIVRFWRRHRPWLGAHVVYQSPLYADPEKAARRRGVAGIRGSAPHRWLAVGHLGVIVGLLVWIASAGSSERFFLHWAGLVIATVAATTWVPGLTQFGEGFKYLRYGVFPWSFVLGVWGAGAPGWGALALLGVLAAQVSVTLRAVRAQRDNSLAAVDGDARAAIEALGREQEDGVLALPVTQADAIAYLGDKRVLWGGHGRGWDRLAQFFPVLRRPVESFLDEYALRWLWVDSRYVDIGDLALPEGRLELRLLQGPIHLFHYDPRPATPVAEGFPAAWRGSASG